MAVRKNPCTRLRLLRCVFLNVLRCGTQTIASRHHPCQSLGYTSVADSTATACPFLQVVGAFLDGEDSVSLHAHTRSRPVLKSVDFETWVRDAVRHVQRLLRTGVSAAIDLHRILHGENGCRLFFGCGFGTCRHLSRCLDGIKQLLDFTSRGIAVFGKCLLDGSIQFRTQVGTDEGETEIVAGNPVARGTHRLESDGDRA